VGNCASALIQGVEYYRHAPDDGFIPGLMRPRVDGYHVGDIEFSAAFDIDARKVGLDLSEAILSEPNNTVRFAQVPHLGVPVHRGMTHDGLGQYLSQVITKATGPTADITGILRETRTDVVVNFLPVGSEMATKWYVEQILDAGCGFVNCIPVFIARESYWQRRFEERGLPVVGDDVKSQVGATIVHRILTKLFMDRGVHLERTSQLNVGGNTDFYNMLERQRLVSKKISKTDSVRSQLSHEMPDDSIHIGPSDYIPWLADRKWAHIRMEGKSFGDQPINIELKLEVWDSPNSAGVVIDAIRCCKIAMDRGLKGALLAPSAYLMKSRRSSGRTRSRARASASSSTATPRTLGGGLRPPSDASPQEGLRRRSRRSNGDESEILLGGPLAHLARRSTRGISRAVPKPVLHFFILRHPTS
jgi:myo-inositol-1-phosphate synthase